MDILYGAVCYMRSLLGAAHKARRIADDHGVLGHIGRYDGTRADDRKVSNSHSWQDNRARPDKHPYADVHAAGETRVAAQVSPGSDPAIVFDGGVVVHDCVVADNRIDL